MPRKTANTRKVYHKGEVQNKNPETVEISGFFLVRHEGFEPPTFAFVVRYSIQLS